VPTFTYAEILNQSRNFIDKGSITAMAMKVNVFLGPVKNNNNIEQADKHISKKTPNNPKQNSTGPKHRWKTHRV
jgi:uncharacterized membrane protein